MKKKTYSSPSAKVIHIETSGPLALSDPYYEGGGGGKAYGRQWQGYSDELGSLWGSSSLKKDWDW